MKKISHCRWLASYIIVLMITSRSVDGFKVQNFLLPHFVSGEQMTKTWSVKLDIDTSKDHTGREDEASRIAEEMDMINLGQVGELKGHYVFCRRKHQVFHQPNHTLVKWIHQQPILKRTKRAPLLEKRSAIKRRSSESYLNIKDPLYPDQWHLANKFTSRKDCNVTGVWAYNITGRGVTVAVVDDGVQWRHPDLKNNYSPAGSFDLNSDDDDPTPEYDNTEENKHGTRCAGEVSAVLNDVCGVGIAYNSKISGIRILDGPMTDSLEATAFTKRLSANDVYSCSWGPDDDGKTVDGPRSLAQEALKHGVVAGRSGYGSIFVVASGNGGKEHDNCNYDGYANSIYTITIGAVNEFGETPSYSEQCSSMLACTVSSGGRGRSIVTTDWTLGKSGQQCTRTHTGTSAATPLVAGMIALILEVRPCLHWRDIQHIIVWGSVPIHQFAYQASKTASFVKNKAGFVHSNEHGFGLINAWRLVNIAKTWKSVPWLTSFKPKCSGTNFQIPKKNPKVLTTSVTKSDCEQHMINTLEYVLVTVTVSHPSRGFLKFIIVCPSGTYSIIYPRKLDISSKGLNQWTFTTLKCWGETASGDYQLKVIDTSQGNLKPGIIKKWQFTLYGSKLTAEDIQQRHSELAKTISGESLHNDSVVHCPVKHIAVFDISEFLSERTLKLLAMMSCFIMFWCLYYVCEVAYCYEDEDKTNDNNDNASEENLTIVENDT